MTTIVHTPKNPITLIPRTSRVALDQALDKVIAARQHLAVVILATGCPNEGGPPRNGQADVQMAHRELRIAEENWATESRGYLRRVAPIPDVDKTRHHEVAWLKDLTTKTSRIYTAGLFRLDLPTTRDDDGGKLESWVGAINGWALTLVRSDADVPKLDQTGLREIMGFIALIEKARPKASHFLLDHLHQWHGNETMSPRGNFDGDTVKTPGVLLGVHVDRRLIRAATIGLNAGPGAQITIAADEPTDMVFLEGNGWMSLVMGYKLGREQKPGPDFQKYVAAAR
jgi:hypothetical protein